MHPGDAPPRHFCHRVASAQLAFANRYRKHFHLPTDWQNDGGATFVHFEGVFHHSTLFLNGKFLMQHECGYTGFDVRLVRPIAATFPSLPLETSYLRRTTTT